MAFEYLNELLVTVSWGTKHSCNQLLCTLMNTATCVINNFSVFDKIK